MKVTGIWSLLGLGIIGLIVADLVLPSHQAGTKAAAGAVTGLEANAGNQLIGSAAK